MRNHLVFAICAMSFVSIHLWGAASHKLVASNAGDYDFLGYSVDLEGCRAVVGAPYADNGSGAQSGRAFVYTFTGCQWTQTELAAYAGADERFGSAVAIEGNLIAVGAPGGNSVYLYAFNGIQWNLYQILTGTGGFGNAIDIDRGTLVIGADADLGKAYVYRFNGSICQPEQTLTAPVPDPLPNVNDSPHFGHSVGIDNDTLVIGASQYTYGGKTYSGAAWVYVYNGSQWVLQADLAALAGTDLKNNHIFGESVDIEGDTLLIGADRDIAADASSGAVYVFERNGAAWSKRQKLRAADPNAGYFGCSVSLKGDRAAIGADYTLGKGCVYEFQKTGGTWSKSGQIAADDSGPLDWFGYDVALEDHCLIAGAFKNDQQAIDAGAAYVYHTPCKRFNAFQVNTLTENLQSKPVIAASADHGFIAVWQSQYSTTTDPWYEVVMQRYNDHGIRLGNECVVNQSSYHFQGSPDIAVQGDGSFVVTWKSVFYYSGDNTSVGIFARRFHADGTPASNEFRVNTYEPQFNKDIPRIAINESGDFMIAWKSFHDSYDPVRYHELRGRVYAADGTPKSTDFQIAADIESASLCAVESDGHDGFTVVYHSNAGPLRAREYDSSGAAKGSLYTLTENLAEIRPFEILRDPSGYLVLLYCKDAGAATDIYARKFSPSFSCLIGATVINERTTVDAVWPSIAAFANGDYLIGWTQKELTGLQDDFVIRRFSASLAALETEQILNAEPCLTDASNALAVAVPEGTCYAAIWCSCHPNSQKEISAAIGPKTWPGDVTLDGVIDADDFCLLTEHWLCDEPVLDLSSVRGSGPVNFADFKILAEYWQMGF